jgi:hypothetical protein
MAGFLTWNSLVKSTLAQTQEARKTQKWEYCYVSAPYSTINGWKVKVSRGGELEIRDSDVTGATVLNKLGSEGWELVGTSAEVYNQGNNTAINFYLKRAR